jgi:hypothetical protein
MACQRLALIWVLYTLTPIRVSVLKVMVIFLISLTQTNVVAPIIRPTTGELSFSMIIQTVRNMDWHHKDLLETGAHIGSKL